MTLRPTDPGHRIVKVCGIRTPEDLTAAEGADWIGVVVDVLRSPRNRTLEQARGIFSRAERRFGTVAVLVDPTEEKVRHVLDEAAPDLLQVHGPVPRSLGRTEAARVVPSMAIPIPGAVPAVLKLPEGTYPWVHLDSAGGPLPGGTGRALDWSQARTLVQEHPDTRFLLAGGLTPENVAEALRSVQPHGVDVSSGVESRPGEKSRAKVERFLAEVRSAESEVATAGVRTKPPAGGAHA